MEKEFLKWVYNCTGRSPYSMSSNEYFFWKKKFERDILHKEKEEKTISIIKWYNKGKLE